MKNKYWILHGYDWLTGYDYTGSMANVKMPTLDNER
jgi:hypothetical protein